MTTDQRVTDENDKGFDTKPVFNIGNLVRAGKSTARDVYDAGKEYIEFYQKDLHGYDRAWFTGAIKLLQLGLGDATIGTHCGSTMCSWHRTTEEGEYIILTRQYEGFWIVDPSVVPDSVFGGG